MATFKLSIEEVRKNCESFLYVYAVDEFVSLLGAQAQKAIIGKRANQRKVLISSAKNANIDVQQYYTAVKEGFVSRYGMTPEQALVALAQGKTVAGKNWSKGVYGIGLTPRTTFAQNSEVTVDPKTGRILLNGRVALGQYPIYADGYKNGIQGYVLNYGKKTYISNVNGSPVNGVGDADAMEYSAAICADVDGQELADGSAADADSTANVWMNVASWIEKIVNWIISLFGGTNEKLINKDNTLPSQADGFTTQEAGVSPVLVAGMVALAAGTLLNKKGKKK